MLDNVTARRLPLGPRGIANGHASAGSPTRRKQPSQPVVRRARGVSPGKKDPLERGRGQPDPSQGNGGDLPPRSRRVEQGEGEGGRPSPPAPAAHAAVHRGNGAGTCRVVDLGRERATSRRDKGPGCKDREARTDGEDDAQSGGKQRAPVLMFYSMGDVKNGVGAGGSEIMVKE
ncbi:hypothetical protein THAOC_14610 [Thalassiosira oceanica]|uniref:Uncharacterized protein n=1 Tax=Thalassiosira oceanica TaxID=159749 RepID=K0SUI0_THAOC|nr:hypothetical protein THAOC_14610 [Thalassiosira oceanica]|eukprot:EJK64636.1 hypothetical protein THAOC_14610 [Thalassiosira oceanica]